MGADRPVLIEAVVDPATPLLPPRLTDAQVENLDASLAAEATDTAARGRVALRRQGVSDL